VAATPTCGSCVRTPAALTSAVTWRSSTSSHGTRLGLFGKLKEDGFFRAFTFSYGERGAVSRDLLDNVNEINYLNDRIGLAEMKAPTVLDIGAGYGRLAYRMSEALPNLAGYDCTDAIPVSTFLWEYYLGFRGVPGTVRVVPLSEIDYFQMDARA
jgi:hypothetical protein